MSARSPKYMTFENARLAMLAYVVSATREQLEGLLNEIEPNPEINRIVIDDERATEAMEYQL